MCLSSNSQNSQTWRRGEERGRSGGLLWVTATDPSLLPVAPRAPSVSRWMGNHTRRCSRIKRSGKKEGNTWRYVNKTVWEVKERSTEFSLAQTGASGVHAWTLTPFIGSFFEAGSPRKTNRIVPIALKSLTIKQIQNDSWVCFLQGKTSPLVVGLTTRLLGANLCGLIAGR